MSVWSGFWIGIYCRADVSVVAPQADQVLGHIVYSPVFTTPPSAAKGFGLCPAMVHLDFQGRGSVNKSFQSGCVFVQT